MVILFRGYINIIYIYNYIHIEIDVSILYIYIYTNIQKSGYWRGWDECGCGFLSGA